MNIINKVNNFFRNFFLLLFPNRISRSDQNSRNQHRKIVETITLKETAICKEVNPKESKTIIEKSPNILITTEEIGKSEVSQSIVIEKTSNEADLNISMTNEGSDKTNETQSLALGVTDVDVLSTESARIENSVIDIDRDPKDNNQPSVVELDGTPVALPSQDDTPTEMEFPLEDNSPNQLHPVDEDSGAIEIVEELIHEIEDSEGVLHKLGEEFDLTQESGLETGIISDKQDGLEEHIESHPQNNSETNPDGLPVESVLDPESLNQLDLQTDETESMKLELDQNQIVDPQEEAPVSITVTDKDLPEIKTNGRTKMPEKSAQSFDKFRKELLAKKIKKPEMKYYAHFINQRLRWQALSDDDVDLFLKNLEKGTLDSILTWPIELIENYLFSALKRVGLIGELPISRESFIALSQYARSNSKKRNISAPKQISPSLFITLMVFCARYSEHEARNFWSPYCQQVWDKPESDIPLQNNCRGHFKTCRTDLAITLGMKFNIKNEGDVVRPVYQHAIIPHYLMGDLAEWIVSNSEKILNFNPSQLPYLLHEDKSIGYMPSQLRNFLTREETSQSATDLLEKMAKAISLFRETEKPEMIESLIDSPIEKSLWNAIYNRLIFSSLQISKLRKTTPKLEWVWFLEKDEIGISLSGVKSSIDEKPDQLFIVNSSNFIEPEIHQKLDPWRYLNKRWDLDQQLILLDNLNSKRSVFILSENFDLDKNYKEQEERIVFSTDLPLLAGQFLFFSCTSNRDYARQKEMIHKSGDWIIVSRSDYEIFNSHNTEILRSSLRLPASLRKLGFKTACRYSIDLPVKVVMGDETQEFRAQGTNQNITANLFGLDQVPNLSKSIPNVFLSSNIQLNFSFDPNEELRRVWFTINNGGSVSRSISFKDLLHQSYLQITENEYRISLNPFLTEAGFYQVDILYGLKSVLDEPITFGYLPGIKVTQPSLDTVFSPVNPFQCKINGVSCQDIVNPDDTELSKLDDSVKIKWKIHKQSDCSFYVRTQGGLIKFLWEIKRVSAWEEGSINKNIVEEGQENEVTLFVRGAPNQRYSWRINQSQKEYSQLDAKGAFTRKIGETFLRDVLRESSETINHIDVEIQNEGWEVFQFWKYPQVEFINITFKERHLFISLEIRNQLRGSFSFQLSKKEVQSIPDVILDVDILKNYHQVDIDLQAGEYYLEILLNGKRLAVSKVFTVGEKVVAKPTVLAFPHVGVENSPELIFTALTSNQTQLLLHDAEKENLISQIKQLIKINQFNTWYGEPSDIDNGIFRLLPSWAVVNKRLAFIMSPRGKYVHIYPEKVAYGGQVGKGYANLTTERERVRVYAEWKPDNNGIVTLNLGFPANSESQRNIDTKPICELDVEETWPAYQCVDCGYILGSKNGINFQVPPSTYYSHLHGKQRKAQEQFIDTRWDKKKRLIVTISQDKNDKDLIHTYQPDNAIYRDYWRALESEFNSRYGDLMIPIDFFKYDDYCIAVTDLHHNYKNSEEKNLIDHFMANEKIFNSIEKFFSDRSENKGAYSAMLRLNKILTTLNHLSLMPKYVLMFCMLLRLKANNLSEYQKLLAFSGLQEKTLIHWTDWAMSSFPKLLEWALAWAEVFYVHSIS